jgi:hypothetical protein
MVIAVESASLDRIRATRLYRYVLSQDGFELHDATAGHWLSRSAATPLAVEPVGDLLAALASESVELRITPALTDLWSRVTASTLEFSGTRLRNAQGWPARA